MSQDYKAHFGLTGKAFHKSIPVASLFRYPQLDEVHYLLTSAVADGHVAVLTGPVGAGKSTTLRAFAASLDGARQQVLYVGYTSADRGIFREMAHGLGLTPAHLKGDLVVQLHHAIQREWQRQGRAALLVLDDAHLLPDALLEEVRQLLNFEMDSATHLGLVLVGQPALLARLREPRHEALARRAPIRCQLVGLSRQEAVAYVGAHLAAAGGDPELFSPEAVDLAYQHAQGLPRELCHVCVYALIRAAWQDLPRVERVTVEEVLRALSAK